MYSICILIYILIKLPIFARYISTGCRLCFRAILGAPEKEDRVITQIHSGALIEQEWRCTSRRLSSVFGDTLGWRDWVNFEMHPEIWIERLWRRTWGPGLCDIGGCNQASLEMHLEAIIV